MRARVKATGEVFEIASYATIPMECCDSFGEPLRFYFDEVEILSEENDLKESEIPDYWTRLEHQYAGMAMQGLMTILPNIGGMEGRTPKDEIIDIATETSHALVEKLKEKEEMK